MTVETVPLPAAVTAVEATSRGSLDGTGAYVFTGEGAFLASPCANETTGWCVDATEPTALPAPSTVDGIEPLPDGRIASTYEGEWLVSAWLAAPTTRYAHGVLGDGIEAGALVCAVQSRSGTERLASVATVLEDGSVYEDVTPRVVDLDSDGVAEVVTIRSDDRGGGSLVVHDVVPERTADGGVAVLCPLVARTPPIGTPNRWLNPAAIHDFDGDGVLDVALVETPHIGGELQLWSGASLLAGKPVMLAARRGYSNHAIGSRVLDLAEMVRMEGSDALVLPDASRRALVAVRYENGEWVEIARADLPARALTGIAAVGRDLAVGLEDGTLARVVVAD